MNFFPSLLELQNQQALQEFSHIYTKASGLPIPDTYLHNPQNRVFGIHWNQELIGGFILGKCTDFRTISLFAQAHQHETLYAQLKDQAQYTEICCFWIKKELRTRTVLNFFIWLAMAYSLKRYGTRYLLFGTCSCSLAKLYAASSKVKFMSQDYINRKATFIFWAEQRHALLGISEIILYKLKRIIRLASRSAPSAFGTR